MKLPPTVCRLITMAALICGTAEAIDRNQNAIDDGWEALHSISSATGDADGDGASNLVEYAFGTLPNDPVSQPNLSISRGTGSRLVLTWDTVLHKATKLQYSDDLVSWYDFTSSYPGTGSALTYTIFSGSVPMRFYRVAAAVPLDTDGDGVDDWLESNIYNTQLNDGADWLSDADGDSIPRIFEEVKGTDPNNPASKPAPDSIVDPSTSNSSSTDNIYATI